MICGLAGAETKREKSAECTDVDAVIASCRLFATSNTSGLPETLELGSRNWKNCTPPPAESIEALATNEPFFVLTKTKLDEEGPFNNPTLTNASEAASTASGNTDTTTGTGGACTRRPQSADRDCATSEFQMETFSNPGPLEAGTRIVKSVDEREEKKT